jgi:hypothetical protein
MPTGSVPPPLDARGELRHRPVGSSKPVTISEIGVGCRRHPPNSKWRRSVGWKATVLVDYSVLMMGF